MTQHPRSGCGLLRVEDAELGFPSAGGSDFIALRAATTTAAARVGVADARFVTALFIHRMGFAFHRAHQREVRREDQPLAHARALGTRRRIVPLVDR